MNGLRELSFLFAFAKMPCSLLQAASFMPRSNQKKNNELTPSSSGMQPKSFKPLTRCWVGCKNSFTFLKERHKGGYYFFGLNVAGHRRQFVEIRVECYAGYRGEETPRRIWLGKRKIEVREIQDRWLAPTHRYFKIHGDDNAIYILRHNSETWEWDLTFYRQAKDPADTP